MRIDLPDEFVASLAEKLRGGALDHQAPLPVKAAAERLGVTQKQIRIWAKSGRLRRVPGCRRVLIPAAEVAAMAAGR